VREMTRRDGLAEAHFRWSRTGTKRLRRATTGLAAGYIPAAFVAVVALADSSGEHLHSLVRLSFILLLCWVAAWTWSVQHPTKGVLADFLARNPHGVVSKLRYIWCTIFVVCPLAMVVMLGMGYLYAAFEMTVHFRFTGEVIVGSVVLYELLLRWFTIRERKMALAQLLESRRARREAAESGDEPGEESHLEVEEDRIDLIAVGAQTRQLLRFTTGAIAVVWLWYGWSDVYPFMETLDTTPLFWRMTIADLMVAILLMAATVALVKNLPGLLEVVILRNLSIDSGSRYAITTLAQYSIGAIGIAAVTTALNLEWSRFGWIAAALSVGLGFGLQEVVANFVCGILLLFERPMRIGDVVTVGDVSGVVSKIQMRATTIVDWDRKEFVVPNKEFVTGRLLNWTLSNRTSRITIMVGVSYGSDTDRVSAILAKCAAKNSDILEEPVPMVTFRNFGDSSLDFEVRCYLPDTDRRLQVYHAMHSEIHRRFAQEGIEIPFPQRDLHMRSGGGAPSPAGGE
jgi:potassium efflux system protein